jgi:hypothetical protein
MNPQEIFEWANLWSRSSTRASSTDAPSLGMSQKLGRCSTFGDAGQPEVVRRVLQCVVRFRASVSWPRANAEHHLSEKPVRMSETTAMSWAHLTPPKINMYVRPSSPSYASSVSQLPARQIHFVCNPSTGPCATKLRALLFEVSLQAGRPP